MTNNIYPPDHLLRKWEELIIDEEQNVDVVLYEAFQAGADQELEACCQEVHDWYGNGSRLRDARRPKPPSLQDQALDDLERIAALLMKNNLPCDTGNIRRALESLPS